MSGRLRARIAETTHGLRAVRFSDAKGRDVECVFASPSLAPQLVKQINDGPYPIWPCFVAAISLFLGGVFG